MQKNENKKKISFSNRIIDLLQKNLTWSILAVVATVASPFIYDYFKSSTASNTSINDIDSLRSCIIERIKEIENKFRPNDILVNLDTANYDVAKVRDFQLLTLEFTKLWKVVDDETRFSDLENDSFDYINYLQESRFLRNIDFGFKKFEILGDISELYLYGVKNDLYYYKFDEPRFDLLIEEMGKEDGTNEETKKLLGELEKLKKKHNIPDNYNNVDSLPNEIKDVLKKLYILENKMFHTKEKYQSDLSFLEEMIKLNNQYSIGLDRYKKGINQEVSDTL